MFSQALMQEGKQPPSHKGRCRSCQIQALNPTPLTCACIPAARCGGGNLAGLQEQRAGASGCWRGGFLSCISPTLVLCALEAWGPGLSPIAPGMSPRSVWQQECFCEQSLWGTERGSWIPLVLGGHCWLSSGFTQRKGLLGIVCKQFPGNSGSPALPVSDEKERGSGENRREKQSPG